MKKKCARKLTWNVNLAQVVELQIKSCANLFVVRPNIIKSIIKNMHKVGVPGMKISISLLTVI